MMRKFIFILFTMIVHNGYGQDVRTGSLESGIDKFTFGSARAGYDTTIKILAGGVTKTCSVYQYVPSMKDPLDLGGVQFATVMLVFDAQDKLVEIDFTKFYREKTSRHYKKEAAQDTKKLLDHLISEWSKADEKTTYARSASSLGDTYEWNAGNTVMKFNTAAYKNSQTVLLNVSLALK